MVIQIALFAIWQSPARKLTRNAILNATLLSLLQIVSRSIVDILYLSIISRLQFKSCFEKGRNRYINSTTRVLNGLAIMVATRQSLLVHSVIDL